MIVLAATVVVFAALPGEWSQALRASLPATAPLPPRASYTLDARPPNCGCAVSMPHDGGFCCVLSAWTTASCSMRATPGAPRS
ncbi:hypothetical protein OG979_06480 [Actinomadura citrea]|uniref:hypothetical protein n=1 Tax=Actinomadura citrea TaxID=46158 RepID=UPI002E2BC3BE|nr:hypothetical protein [Actinomadura citrea]